MRLVNEELKNTSMKLGFLIKSFIGAGYNGTTLLCQWLVRKEEHCAKGILYKISIE